MNHERRKQRREIWLRFFRLYRRFNNYPVGMAKHLARMSVDQILKQGRTEPDQRSEPCTR